MRARALVRAHPRGPAEESLLVNIGMIITTVRYDYVYRLLNMYLLTNYTNDRRSKATSIIRTRFLLLGFVIMLDKSIRRNKTCCRRKALARSFSARASTENPHCESIITQGVSLIILSRPQDPMWILMSISPLRFSSTATPAPPAATPSATLSRKLRAPRPSPSCIPRSLCCRDYPR